MRSHGCPWEPEVIRAIAEGRGSEHLEPDLREHAAACAGCADLIEVAVALARDRESVVRSGPVPASGVVWWRTQHRLRREAERSARRTVAVVQGAILGVCSVAALTALGWLSSTPRAWLESFVAHATSWSDWLPVALVGWTFMIAAAARCALATHRDQAGFRS